jgi:predicted O-methyltransferase YrrM
MKQRIERILQEVPTWCPVYKAHYMQDLVVKLRPKKVVEVGVYGGGSAFALALALEANGSGMLTGIDPWKNADAMQHLDDNLDKVTAEIDFVAIYLDLNKKIRAEKLEKYFTLIRETSKNSSTVFEDKSVELLHIDGNHATDSVISDLKTWYPKLSNDAMIIIDDIDWPSVNIAVRLFDEIIEIENRGTFALYKKKGIK